MNKGIKIYKGDGFLKNIIKELSNILYSRVVDGEFFIINTLDRIYIIFATTNEIYEYERIINIIRNPKYTVLHDSILELLSSYAVAIITHKREVILINGSAFEKKYGECFEKSQFEVYRIGIKKNK